MTDTATRPEVVARTHARPRPFIVPAWEKDIEWLAPEFKLREACPPAPGVSWWGQEPTPRQHAFLMGEERERLYGGGAGGGKSSALLMAGLQYVCVPGYQALLMRRTFPQLADSGGLIERAKAWLMPLVEQGHVEWNDSRHRFTFPSGAGLWFNFAGRNDDRWKFQSSEYQTVGFDEVTHWPDPVVYLYVGFSRVRGPALPCGNCGEDVHKETGGWRHYDDEADQRCGQPSPSVALPACPGCGLTLADVPLRTMAGTNPGGRGHAWVKRRYGLRRHGERDPEHVATYPHRLFIKALMEDNPHLNRRTYREGLAELDAVERVRLEHGDWDASETGRMFSRLWIVGENAA
jgi:hypothetical protein